MADKVKEVAVEEAEHIKSLARDAARAGAYLYPVRVSVVSSSRFRIVDSSLFFATPSIKTQEACETRQSLTMGSRVSSTSSPTAAFGNLLPPSSPLP